jgi:deoxyribodipyrimidine photo-lyase
MLHSAAPEVPHIATERVCRLNSLPEDSEQSYVLYWMQGSQRAQDNAALEYAAHRANELRLPLVTVFGLFEKFPEANARSFLFLLEGLADIEASLRKRRVLFHVERGRPDEIALKYAKRAALVVCDRAYLRPQKEWRRKLASEVGVSCIEVEGDVIVPVRYASDKREFAARTIRPKIQRGLAKFLKPVPCFELEKSALKINLPNCFEVEDPQSALRKLSVDTTVPTVSQFFKGGTTEAKKRFSTFLSERLGRYVENRSKPETDDVSRMSVYLHYGQISPNYLALEVSKYRDKHPEAVDAYLEELAVRRELGINFVEYEPHYDAVEKYLPEWCLKTLKTHIKDKREHTYSIRELEQAETHDPYWNSAMREAIATGFMHNYLRMYWGKKILEWSTRPSVAYDSMIKIMNRWFLDGRDPLSYSNVGWIFGLHDRPWGERPIYGTVRCMMASGLERKCDMEAYEKKVARYEALSQR